MNPAINPIGAVSAILVLGVLVGTIGQLLDAHPISRMRTSGDGSVHPGSNNIIVPLTMGTDVCAASYLACQVGKPYDATIILAYIMDLPPTLSLDAALPEWEGDAQRALTAGTFVVQQQDLAVESRIIRHRSVVGAVLDLARATDAREIILTTHKTARRFFPRVDPTVTHLLRRAPCQVIVAESLGSAA